MNYRIVTRFLLGAIIFSAMCLVERAVSGEGWPTNYQHFNDIRTTAKELDKGTRIMFTLTDGTLVFGEFLKYEVYTDYIWYQPQGTGRNWFKQDAFDVHELFRIDIVMEPV